MTHKAAAPLNFSGFGSLEADVAEVAKKAGKLHTSLTEGAVARLVEDLDLGSKVASLEAPLDEALGYATLLTNVASSHSAQSTDPEVEVLAFLATYATAERKTSSLRTLGRRLQSMQLPDALAKIISSIDSLETDLPDMFDAPPASSVPAIYARLRELQTQLAMGMAPAEASKRLAVSVPPVAELVTNLVANSAPHQQWVHDTWGFHDALTSADVDSTVGYSISGSRVVAGAIDDIVLEVSADALPFKTDAEAKLERARADLLTLASGVRSALTAVDAVRGVLGGGVPW